MIQRDLTSNAAICRVNLSLTLALYKVESEQQGRNAFLTGTVRDCEMLNCIIIILCSVGNRFMDSVLGFSNKGKFNVYYENLMYGMNFCFRFF
ncbi:hypothetical protein LEP1GSC170_4386 [Leptospira interrogans serovar Bataviae str. HAI135]|nr:hypothetical protein LEP1GSC170_4386 [Leptospira interrogans serovar Bataviae str. HAI135]